MRKPSFANLFYFFFIKYLLFYILMMFKNKDFTLIQLNQLRNLSDIFFYLWIFLFLPVVCFIIFSLPIYFIFKLKNAVVFIIFLILVLAAEYVSYTYSASQIDLFNGVYNELLSIVLLIAFYFKVIKLKFKKD